MTRGALGKTPGGHRMRQAANGSVHGRTDRRFRRCVSSAGRLRALSMVESVVSVALVSLLLAAALDALGATKASERLTAEQRLGTMLAQDLLDEILHVSYFPPAGTAVVPKILGLEILPIVQLEDSCAPPVRACFDDLQDYDDWTESPPERRDGTEMSEFAGWSRSVRVEHVKGKGFDQIMSSETGFRRVYVEARYQGRLVGKATVLRVSALPLSVEMP